MMAETDPSGFDTIAGRPDYYIDFLDARTSIDDERRVKQVVVGLLQAQDGLDVLDVGTGTGDDARELAALVAPRGRVVGVDRSPEMVAEALRRSSGSGLPIEFVEGDAQALDFPDASFDRCRAERVLIHLRDPAAAVRIALRNVARYPFISAIISRTAASRPTSDARAMIEWPMFSSSMSAIGAIAPMLR